MSSREELLNKFKGEVDQADWEMLQPHYSRGALFYVSRDLNIFEVAADLALDNVSAVKDYLDSGQFKKATEEHLEAYSIDKNKFFANFVVIQPYVLFQPYE